MPWGSRSEKVTLDHTGFLAQMRTNPAYTKYKGVVGSGLASAMLAILWDESKREAGPDGYWSKKKVRNQAPPTTLKFKTDQGLTHLLKGCADLLTYDAAVIGVRWNQVSRMLVQAKGGDLAKQLNENVKRRREYQVLQAPRTPAPGAPPIPDKGADQKTVATGLAWLTDGVQGGTDSYRNVIFKYKTTGFPLGGDAQIVTKMWTELVGNTAGVPKWRKTVIGSAYPSSIGGTYLLRKIFTTGTGMGWPAQGDTKWEDWAMYFFAAIMNVQAFPDGNKRIARTVYVLMMISGGIPFKAPTDALAKKLAAM